MHIKFKTWTIVTNPHYSLICNHFALKQGKKLKIAAKWAAKTKLACHWVNKVVELKFDKAIRRTANMTWAKRLSFSIFLSRSLQNALKRHCKENCIKVPPQLPFGVSCCITQFYSSSILFQLNSKNVHWKEANSVRCRSDSRRPPSRPGGPNRWSRAGRQADRPLRKGAAETRVYQGMVIFCMSILI